MSKNKRVKSISFNVNHDKDIARLKHIGKRSFSKYIKRLIDEDIERSTVIPTATTRTPKQPPQQAVIPPKREQPLIPKEQPKPKTFINPMLKGHKK